jgi:hypothetical protein
MIQVFAERSEETHHLQRVCRVVDYYFKDMRVRSATEVLLENNFPAAMVLEFEWLKFGSRTPRYTAAGHVTEYVTMFLA